MNHTTPADPAAEPGAWYLVRHGQTTWNKNRRIQGHANIPLSEQGKLQIAALARRIHDRRFAAIYASDLDRTIHSARILAGSAETPVEPVPDLREFSYGEWEGLMIEEVETRDPHRFAARMAGAHEAFAAPGGENTLQVLARVRQFHSQALQRRQPADHVLVVAHGGSLRALLVCLLGLPDECFWRFRLDVASLSVVRTYPEGGVLELWNDTSHLASAQLGNHP